MIMTYIYVYDFVGTYNGYGHITIYAGLMHSDVDIMDRKTAIYVWMIICGGLMRFGVDICNTRLRFLR